MSEIAFKSDTKHRKGWFTGMSFSHPAKMVLPLQLWLIENFTKEGETILDPMSGSGTILVACSMGRNVIAVELEQKFVDMQKGNWQKIQERGPMMGYKMGIATILQGDARNLSGLLADKIVTSPPYANRLSDASVNDGDPQRMSYRQSLEGLADKIITSPPFFNSLHQVNQSFNLYTGPGHYEYSEESRLKRSLDYGQSNGQISRLPYGSIDSVITSPPYENQLHDRGDTERELQSGIFQHRSYRPGQSYSVDSIITSPPYEGTIEKPLKEGTSRGLRNRKMAEVGKRSQTFFEGGYSNNSQNIGNLKSDSYLEAMRQVYSECHKVLKDGGLMCLVLKNFIRNKAIVRLDLDTIRLIDDIGFRLKERHERRLTNQSFWRTIYKQKYPDAPEINQEDILVFKKV